MLHHGGLHRVSIFVRSVHSFCHFLISLLFAGRLYLPFSATFHQHHNMFHSTLVLSLLVSTATIGFALPAPNAVSPEGVSTSCTISTAAATPTSGHVDDDQPAPYKSISIPASETFNSLSAMAFTGTPSSLPVYATDSSVPPPAVYSDFFSTTIPAELATQTPSVPAASTSPTSCTESKNASPTALAVSKENVESLETSPSPTASGVKPAQDAIPSKSSTPTLPSGSSKPTPPAGGFAGPRPTGMFPSYPGYRPRPFGHHGVPRPAAPAVSDKPAKQDAAVGVGKLEVSSKPPCSTLQTRVRPTPTPIVY